jgi:ribosomal protein S18 acetylase RimI-like enzyme
MIILRNLMIAFRNATNADLDLTYQIKKASIKPYIEQIWGWDEEVQVNYHVQDFKPEQIKILINEDGLDIGLFSVIESDTSFLVQNLLLSDSAQGNGIGTAVLSHLIEQAESLNKKIELQVFKVNERAKAFYERLGFKIVEKTEQHYQMAIENF